LRPRTICALLLAIAACAKPDPPSPDVLLITLDTTRADHLSCYGYALPTSPALDALAADGALFRECRATAGLTPVSHASILTGLDPYQHGLRVLHAKSGCRLPDDVPTLATVLRDAGYATGAFLSAYPVSEAFGFARGFDVYDEGIQVETKPERGSAVTMRDQRQTRSQRRSDATVDAALEWIEGSRGPWFAWIHLWDPHDPVLVPPKTAADAFVASCPPDPERRLDLYDVEIRFMDAQIGRLLARLKELGRYEGALIVVTADHGQGKGEHGWQSHRIVYEEQLHVPLIVKLPGEVRCRGVEVRDLVRTIDVYPTVIEELDLGAPRSCEGRSLLPLVRGERDEPRLAYADAINKWDAHADILDKRPQDDLLHCLMDRRWKLIYRPLRPDDSELYDLDGDRDEARNLYRELPARARPLVEGLEARRPWVLEPLGAGEARGEAMDALRDLGYVGDGEGTDK
jgi:arylsulfatase A-like enzyme